LAARRATAEGRALDTVEKAHGRYEHWLWPLNYPENIEAGCQQCHASDMVIRARSRPEPREKLYREKGCIGCHRFQGFDNQGRNQLLARAKMIARSKIRSRMTGSRSRNSTRGRRCHRNDAGDAYYAQATNLTVTISSMDAQIERARAALPQPAAGNQKVGPDLKEVRMKIHKDGFRTGEHTHEFRPTTKSRSSACRRRDSGDLGLHLQSAITGRQLQ